MTMRILSTTLAVCSALSLNTATAGYAEYLQLNDLENHAVLEDNGNPADNIIQLRSTNGTFATIQFEMPTHILAIDLGAGDDRLTVEGLELGVLTAELMIFGNSGNDSINLRGLDTFSNVYSDDFQGDNSLVSQSCFISGNLHVADGDGSQTFYLGGEVSGSIYVQSSSGDSSLRIGQGQFPGLYAIVDGSVLIDQGGYGNDAVQLSGIVQGDFYANMGHGNFTLNSLFSNVGSLYTRVESGTSTVFLGDLAVGGETNISCAEGDTDLQIFFSQLSNGLYTHNGLGFDKVRVQGSSVLNQAIFNNGNGGSSMLLQDDFRPLEMPLVQVTNGFGSDVYDLQLGNRENAVVGTFVANNGRGNSTLNIQGGSPMNSVTTSAGNGIDVITLNGVTIAHDLIAFNSNGGSDVDVFDSYIGGNIDIDSGNRTDYVSIVESSVAGSTNVHTGRGRDTVTVSDSVFASDFVANGGAGYDIYAFTDNNVFGGIEYITQFELLYQF